MNETQLLDAVMDLAALYKWRRAHFRAAFTKRGWRTPVQGDGAGFPDCIFVRGDRLIVAELKSATGKATQAQLDWLKAFELVAETHLWSPASWDDGSILTALEPEESVLTLFTR